jgi:hypothetical protein
MKLDQKLLVMVLGPINIGTPSGGVEAFFVTPAVGPKELGLARIR